MILFSLLMVCLPSAAFEPGALIVQERTGGIRLLLLDRELRPYVRDRKKGAFWVAKSAKEEIVRVVPLPGLERAVVCIGDSEARSAENRSLLIDLVAESVVAEARTPLTNTITLDSDQFRMFVNTSSGTEGDEWFEYKMDVTEYKAPTYRPSRKTRRNVRFKMSAPRQALEAWLDHLRALDFTFPRYWTVGRGLYIGNFGTLGLSDLVFLNDEWLAAFGHVGSSGPRKATADLLLFSRKGGVKKLGEYYSADELEASDDRLVVTTSAKRDGAPTVRIFSWPNGQMLYAGEGQLAFPVNRRVMQVIVVDEVPSGEVYAKTRTK